MSSPSLHSQTGFLRPAIDWRGWRMMTRGPLRGLSICVTTRRLDVSCRETAPGHLITHFSARSVVTGSYGKIVSTCDRHTTTCTDTGPPYGRTASALVVPACKHPPGTLTSRSGYRCRKMFQSSCLYYPSEEVPLVERTLLGCFPRSVAVVVGR
jgi:hypothetical protein